ELEQICKRGKDEQSPVYLYTVYFAAGSSSASSLQEMVDIASKYVPEKGLKCQFVSVPSTLALKDHFVSIAESIKKNQATLIRG
ncbi:6431_t:CDS:2, partial [Paraglomus occultum]